MTDRMLFYSDGKFTMRELEWYKPAPASEAANRDELLNNVGCRLHIHELIGSGGASVEVWITPHDQLIVFLMNGKTEIASVVLPRQIDWLPFYVSYVIPFIQAHAAVRIKSRTERIVQKEQNRLTLKELGRELG